MRYVSACYTPQRFPQRKNQLIRSGPPFLWDKPPLATAQAAQEASQGHFLCQQLPGQQNKCVKIHFFRVIGAAPVVLSTTHTFYANSFTMAGLETSIVHNRKGEILQRPLAGTRQTDQQHIGRQKQEGVSKAPLISLFLS